MADGALLGNFCYASQEKALDIYYSSVPPTHSNGSPMYVTQYEKVSGVWMLKRFVLDGSGNLTSAGQAAAAVPVFPVCDTFESFKDAHALGWGVAAAVIGAAVMMSMRKGI
jgi:hypothetical protein